MLFQRINRTDPEKVFIICRNDGATALAAGIPVLWQSDGTRDGIDVVQPADITTSGQFGGLVGYADKVVSNADYGLIQCYGIRTDVPVRQCGIATNSNGAIGDALAGWASTNSAFSATLAGNTGLAYPFGVVAMQTWASSSATTTLATTIKAFLRLM